MRTNLHRIILSSLIASAMMMSGPILAQRSGRSTPNFGGNKDNGSIHRRENAGNYQRIEKNSSNKRPDNSSHPNFGNNRPSNGNNSGSRPNLDNKRPNRPNNGGNNSSRPNFDNKRPDKPNNSSRPNKPGFSYERPNRPNNGSRPNLDNKRPDKPNNGGHRPNKPNKPGFSYERPNKPHPDNGNHRPGFSYGPGVPPPPHNHNWSRPLPPPQRPYRPIGRPIPRPVPPHGYHPYVGAPVINTIIGLTFGTLYNATLDYLYTNGYEIDGYVDNTIYLRNVRELSFNWPDATMYYDTYGKLNSAQFIYSTSYNTTSRYNRLYNDLCRTYGSPVSSNMSGLSRTTTWYGGDARGYVTLEYDYSNGRYYTILSYGI